MEKESGGRPNLSGPPRSLMRFRSYLRIVTPTFSEYVPVSIRA